MAPLKKALEGKCDTVHATDASSALESLTDRVRGGDVLLIKGSNAVGLSRIVEALISNRSH
jgi:UDP-N-acetylmuramoyl-tripeptide--D-alanyl-D-alanine ligase